jgi:hypothetical protein
VCVNNTADSINDSNNNSNQRYDLPSRDGGLVYVSSYMHSHTVIISNTYIVMPCITPHTQPVDIQMPITTLTSTAAYHARVFSAPMLSPLPVASILCAECYMPTLALYSLLSLIIAPCTCSSSCSFLISISFSFCLEYFLVTAFSLVTLRPFPCSHLCVYPNLSRLSFSSLLHSWMHVSFTLPHIWPVCLLFRSLRMFACSFLISISLSFGSESLLASCPFSHFALVRVSAPHTISMYAPDLERWLLFSQTVTAV